MTLTTTYRAATHQTARPGRVTTMVGVLTALWCLGFATINVVFEVSHHFAGPAYVPYAAGISVMNWVVVGLKLIGAAAAVLSVVRQPRFVPARLIAAALWGAFATLGVYAVGSAAEGVGMLFGLLGGIEQITVRNVGYVLFFTAAAVGFGILTLSHARRHPSGKRPVVLGVLGAPVVLGALLLVAPMVLGALGLLPT